MGHQYEGKVQDLCNGKCVLRLSICVRLRPACGIVCRHGLTLGHDHYQIQREEISLPLVSQLIQCMYCTGCRMLLYT